MVRLLFLLLSVVVLGHEIIVTGGAGFVGSALVRRLVEDHPRQVLVLDNLWSGDLRNLEGIEGFDIERDFRRVDLRDPDETRHHIRDAQVVFHLADVVAGARWSMESEGEILSINMLIDLNVLGACHHSGIPRLIYTGSSASYPGYTSPGLHYYTEENITTNAESAYGWGKLTTEINSQYFTTKTSILRLPNVFGPRSSIKEGVALVIPALISRALEAVTRRGIHTNDSQVFFTVEGDGRSYHDFVYVEDVVDALVSMWKLLDERVVIQLGSENPTNIVELGAMISQLIHLKTGRQVSPRFEPHLGAGSRGRIASNQRARRLLGWFPKTSLWDGLVRTVDDIAKRMAIPAFRYGDVTRPPPKVLVIAIGNVRGGSPAWESLRRHVLKPLQADLMLVVGVNQTAPARCPLCEMARYRHLIPEPEDWSAHLDEASASRDGVVKDWSPLCQLRPQWLGKSRCQHPAAVAALWSLRYQVKKLLTPEILHKYDRYIVTRTDFLYVCDHPLPRLDSRYIWTPFGQEWQGINDRHAVASRTTILPYLEIIEELLSSPLEWYTKLSAIPRPWWGPENIMWEYFQLTGWSRIIRKFYHPAFLVAEPGVDQTLWRVPGKPHPDIPHPGIHVKYEEELRLAQMACPQWREEIAATLPSQ